MNDAHELSAERFLGLLRPIERDLEVFCRRLIFDERDVSDALQNAVLRAYRAFDRYHADASFRAWMFKILTNEAFTVNRKRGRIDRFETAVDPGVIESLAGAEAPPDYHRQTSSWETLVEALDQDLVAALQSLNDMERAVLLLRAIGDLRYREISEALEMPVGSVMGYLARARQKMRDAILRARRRTEP